MRQVAISMHNEAHAEIHHFVEEANEAQKEVKFRHILLRKQQQRSLATKNVLAPKACDKASVLRTAYGLREDDVFIVVVDGNLYDDEDDEYFVVDGSDYPSLTRGALHVGVISLYYLNPASTFMKQVQGEWKEMLDEVAKKRTLSDSVMLLLLGCVTAQLTSLQWHEESRGCIMDYCQTPSELMEALTGGLQFCRGCLTTLEGEVGGQALIAISRRLNERPYTPLRDRTVFLSYTWADEEAVLLVDQWLRNSGMVTRLDRRDFLFGNKIPEEIMRIMHQSSTIVVFYSRNSKDRKYTRFERELARDYRLAGKARVIYFCLDETPLPDVHEETHLAIRAKGRGRDAPCEDLVSGILGLRRPPQEIIIDKYKEKAPLKIGSLSPNFHLLVVPPGGMSDSMGLSYPGGVVPSGGQEQTESAA